MWGGFTLRLRRPLFCCCCCSMSSIAEAGGEAALMALTTLMLSSGSGGRFRRSRPLTFISCSSSKPPRVNWKVKVADRNVLTHRLVHANKDAGIDLHHVHYVSVVYLRGHTVLTSMVFQSSSSTFFMGKCGAFMLQNLVTMVKRSRAKGSPLYRGEPKGSMVKAGIFGMNT